MIDKTKQAGIGVLEVLVALVLLAIGVMGFIGLQYRAIEGLSEADNRIHAMIIARDLAEKMRLNPEQIPRYQQAINRVVSSLPLPNCFTEFCSVEQKAYFDAAWLKLTAQHRGMTLNMMPCPHMSHTRYCAYVAWGETSATDADGLNNCTTAAQYRPESTCLVLEMYS